MSSNTKNMVKTRRERSVSDSGSWSLVKEAYVAMVRKNLDEKFGLGLMKIEKQGDNIHPCMIGRGRYGWDEGQQEEFYTIEAPILFDAYRDCREDDDHRESHIYSWQDTVSPPGFSLKISDGNVLIVVRMECLRETSLRKAFDAASARELALALVGGYRNYLHRFANLTAQAVKAINHESFRRVAIGDYKDEGMLFMHADKRHKTREVYYGPDPEPYPKNAHLQSPVNAYSWRGDEGRARGHVVKDADGRVPFNTYASDLSEDTAGKVHDSIRQTMYEIHSPRKGRGGLDVIRKDHISGKDKGRFKWIAGQFRSTLIENKERELVWAKTIFDTPKPLWPKIPKRNKNLLSEFDNNEYTTELYNKKNEVSWAGLDPYLLSEL
jgi:hypothetical protein